MAKKQTSSPLEDVLNIIGNDMPDVASTTTDMDDPDLAHSENVDDIDKQEPVEDGDPITEENGEDLDDDSEIPEDVLKRMNKEGDSNDDDLSLNEQVDEAEQVDDEEVSEAETQGVTQFFDAFAEALNWDVDENDKPTSIQGLIDYIGDMVEQNSTPQYSDERIAQLDQYVRNGGKFEDFYTEQSKDISYDSLDMDEESNQRAVVRDYLKLSGYDDEQISRKIERYEDADMLSEEAEDAVLRLKEINAARIEEAQKQQEAFRKAQEQQAMEFATNLNNSISGLSSIRGISVPKEDRKALLDYITKTDADGLTQYQKDFNRNLVDNLIESAYFTMKGDALLGEAKRAGQTSAASKLRTMLKHNSKNHSSYNVNDEKPRSVADIASSIYY